MKNIAVIYWSNGGNVEVLADNIVKGAEAGGAKVTAKHVQDAKVEDVTSADAVAFGSPSLDNNKIEQDHMAPFIKEFKLLPVQGKKAVLFGSYGWDEGAFLKDWKNTVEDYGFQVVGELAVKEAPEDAQLQKARELGRLLAE